MRARPGPPVCHRMTPHPDRTKLPDETRIGRTALRVSDLQELATFYTDIVGLETLQQAADTATLGVDGDPLLHLAEDERGGPRPRTAAGLYHTAFRVPSRGALGDALQRIQHRWHLDGASDHHVSEALYLDDPDGNGVEIYRDYPRDQWPRSDDGRVQMDTDPLDMGGVRSAAKGETGAPAGTVIGHVHLEVTSLDAFRTFYVDTLGFGIQTRYPGALFVSAGGYHHHLGANTWQRRTSSAGGRGLAWYEVVVPTAADLADVRERLEARNIAVRDTEDGLSVADPDEIEVRIRDEPSRDG